MAITRAILGIRSYYRRRNEDVKKKYGKCPYILLHSLYILYILGMAGKIYLHNTQDLGSRYEFLPMDGEYPVGEEVAGDLSEKFDRYGAPLVLKRDNEGNMNHTAINDVLAESFVLPLNSPEYY